MSAALKSVKCNFALEPAGTGLLTSTREVVDLYIGRCCALIVSMRERCALIPEDMCMALARVVRGDIERDVDRKITSSELKTIVSEVMGTASRTDIMKSFIRAASSAPVEAGAETAVMRTGDSAEALGEQAVVVANHGMQLGNTLRFDINNAVDTMLKMCVFAGTARQDLIDLASDTFGTDASHLAPRAKARFILTEMSRCIGDLDRWAYNFLGRRSAEEWRLFDSLPDIFVVQPFSSVGRSRDAGQRALQRSTGIARASRAKADAGDSDQD